MFKIRIIFFLICFSAVPVFSQQDDSLNTNALKYFISGKSAELRNDYKGALELYKTALQEQKASL